MPICLAIDPQQLAQLDAAADRLDCSRSWIVGRAIDTFLARSPTPDELLSTYRDQAA